MDKITKILEKLSAKERNGLKIILAQIQAGNFKGTDLKKLKNRKDIYRARKGNLRIIFYKIKKEIKILSLERRTSTTYKK